ncbi:MAG: hypothetical protein IPO21_10930 [Bacteroidales bacterium]|nr:hypothetical protein [Bacteroidales bacterium]
MRAIFILLLITITSIAKAQIAWGGGMPQYAKRNASMLKSTDEVKPVCISLQPKTEFKSDNAMKHDAYIFAYSHYVDIDIERDATWTTLPDGSKLAQMQIVSKGAFSLNLVFSQFELPEGSRLFFYNPDMSIIKGAYTEKNNNAEKVFSITPIKGDTLCIEYTQPAKTNTPVKLKIATVNHDFMDYFKTTNESNGISGSCNVNINCNEGAAWQTEKKSICKIIYNGRELCSGTLMNNTKNDFKPYILTANHCISDNTTASTALFIFNYESSECESDLLTDEFSFTGANLVATDKDSRLDFTLLKLFDIIPPNLDVYFSGWTLDDSQPSGATCIHHPRGDQKNISRKQYCNPR